MIFVGLSHLFIVFVIAPVLFMRLKMIICFVGLIDLFCDFCQFWWLGW